MNKEISELIDIYTPVKERIVSRLKEFENIKENYSEKELFIELAFCLLTPQSKAKNAWQAIQNMLKDDILFVEQPEKIAEYLNIVRFKNNKSKYIVEARNQFAYKDDFDVRSKIDMSDIKKTRNWFCNNVKGIGMKEAGHFLRNTGFGPNLAILDRHILKNLVRYEVIPEVPKSLSQKIYQEIELKMEKFALEIGIPMSNLDFLFWYMEAGDVFK